MLTLDTNNKLEVNEQETLKTVVNNVNFERIVNLVIKKYNQQLSKYKLGTLSIKKNNPVYFDDLKSDICEILDFTFGLDLPSKTKIAAVFSFLFMQKPPLDYSELNHNLNGEDKVPYAAHITFLTSIIIVGVTSINAETNSLNYYLTRQLEDMRKERKLSFETLKLEKENPSNFFTKPIMLRSVTRKDYINFLETINIANHKLKSKDYDMVASSSIYMALCNYLDGRYYLYRVTEKPQTAW